MRKLRLSPKLKSKTKVSAKSPFVNTCEHNKISADADDDCAGSKVSPLFRDTVTGFLCKSQQKVVKRFV